MTRHLLYLSAVLIAAAVPVEARMKRTHAVRGHRRGSMQKIAVFMLVCAASASAGAVTGNQALQLMTGSDDKDLYLSTYAMAFQDQEYVVRLNAKGAFINGATFMWPFCVPNSASVQQVAAVIRKELFTSPENNHQDLGRISRTALTKAWRCTEAELLE